MTTRAGLVGLLTGLVATVLLVYPLAIAWPVYSALWFWAAVITAVFVTMGGGALAVRWSGSVHFVRSVALGGLAGGLAGTLVYCWLGAAAAGLVGNALSQNSQAEALAAIIRQIQGTFLACFLGGIGLGSLGGWLTHPRWGSQADV